MKIFPAISFTLFLLTSLQAEQESRTRHLDPAFSDNAVIEWLLRHNRED